MFRRKIKARNEIVVRANPFVITFDDDADGGPAHFVYLLKGFAARLKKNGVVVAEGLVGEIDPFGEKVPVRLWNEKDRDYNGPTVIVDIWTDIDEINYL